LKLRRWQRLLAYVDIAIIAVLCVVFSSITFSVPLEQFLSPIQATYGRLFSAILLGAGISLAIFIIIDAIFVWPHENTIKPIVMKPTKPHVRPLSEAHAVALVSRFKLLRKLSERSSPSIAKDVVKANETVSPYRLAAKSLFYALIALFICTPIAIYLAVFISPGFLAFMALPAIPLTYFRLKLKSATGDRRRAVDDELPFFAMYASILQSVGVNLYNALLQSIGKSVFKQVEKDALIAKRNVEFFFRSPVEALEEAGKMHPNERMKNLLLGYTSEWRSGGDLARYLEAKADDCLKDMNFKWKNYADKASDLGETTVSLLFVLPMMILMSAFIFPSQAMTMVGATTSIAIPLMTVAVFGLVNASQPKTYDVLKGDLKLSIIAGAVTLASTVLLGTSLWLCFAATLAAASTFYGASVFLQLRENGMLEKMLPQFLRDVTEFRKMGYDISKAIMKISEENTYNTVFNNLLQAVARQMKLGVRIAEVEVPTRSWLTRISFFLLTEILESGGGTASSMEKLTDFVSQVVRTKRETSASMRLYQALSIFTPVGLSLITALMFTLITAFSAAVTPGAPISFLGSIAQVPQGLVDMSYLLVLSSSACIALLTAKTVDLTAKNTLWITVNMALAAGSIVFSVQIAAALINSFVGGTV
jgi:flagellar protein FlaJ